MRIHRYLWLVVLLFCSTMAMATDYHRIFYKTDPCDSIILVHEVAGGVDSAWWTSCSSVDTSIDKAGLSDGTHNFAVLFYFDGDTVAYSVSEAVVIGAVAVDLSGSGLDVLTLYLFDTSGADTVPVASAVVSLSNLAGTPYSYTTTKSGGYTKINFTATDTFLVTASKPGYVLPSAETLIVTGTSTDSLFGYDVALSSPSATAKTCAVNVIVIGQDGNPFPNVTVTAQLIGNNLSDSSGYPVGTWVQTEKTDDNGSVTFNCLWSSYVLPSTKWRFSVQSPLFGNARKEITIPRETAYQVSFIK